MSQPNVHNLLKKLSAAHPLSAPDAYQRNFISAAQNVYPAQRIEQILQDRFFIPDDSKLDLDVYLQSAAELSVQNHLKRDVTVQNFEIGKHVNPLNNTDVEAYFEIYGKHVALEVKCPEERNVDPNSLAVASVGRPPDFFEKAAVLHSVFQNSPLAGC